VNPEVSVVIPAYNAAKFIAMAIDSALAQSYKPSEIIVVDDGSQDNTRSIVEQYENKVRYFHQTNAGPAAARNMGVREARGEWIAFLDSDDYWDRDHLKLLLKHAQDHPEAVLIYCGKIWVDEEGNLIQNSFKQTQFPSGWIFNDMFHANYISTTSAVLVKRDIVIKLCGFDVQLRIAEDYDLWLRIAAISPICGVPIYTVNYRRHDSNLTLQNIRQFKADIVVLKNARSMFYEHRVDSRNNTDKMKIQKRIKQFYKDSSVGLFSLGEYKELQTLGLDAIKNRYLTVHLLIRFLLSWLPSNSLAAMKKIYRGLN
jgi:glycosyltransferase involved in cell wall biosynthesis